MKGEDGITVNQELGFARRVDNGRNLGRAILQTHLPFLKLAGVGLWILQVDI